MTTLANIKSTDTAATTIVDQGGSAPSTGMTLMPPGFEDRPARPIVYIGGSEEGGQPFYTWNFDTESKDFVPVNKFSARLIDIKTLVKNADDEMKRAVKLVCEFETASGGRVAMSCGAKTWSALGLVAGLSVLTPEQLTQEIGLIGKVGKRGVTFVNVYASGGAARNDDAVAMLREARDDDNQIAAIEGYVGDIKAKLAEANSLPALAGA